MFTPQINILDFINAADIAVFAAVLALTAGMVIYGQTLRKKNAGGLLDYMLMGRQLTLPLFVATLAASWYGGIFGVNEITFNYGIHNFVIQGAFWYVAYIIFALFLVNKVKQHQSMTLPDLAHKMFGPKSAKTSAVFTFFNILPISYVLSLGIFLNLVFGMPVVWGMITGTLFVALYSAWGGLRAVVFSDIVQFAVMCLAVFIVLIFSLANFGGLEFLKANLPASHFSITGGNGWLNTLIWGAIALATLVDPAFYQRCFAAKDVKTASSGILICTLIWFCFDVCTTSGALYARALLPGALPAHAYFIYAVQLLPHGLRGFFIAGVLAVILSTLDSFLFIASNTVAYDLLKNKFKNKLLLNQISFFIISALAILLAVFFEGNFKKIWFTLGSYMSACLLIPMLGGYIWPGKIKDGVFTFSALFSAALITVWNILPRSGLAGQIDGFYIGLAVSLIIIGSNILKAKYEENKLRAGNSRR